MSLGLLAAAAVVIAGGIACVVGRRAAVIALGAGAMLTASAFVADAWPPALTLVERVVGGALAAELLWLGLRERQAASGASALAWPAVVLLAAAACMVGLGAQHATPGAGPAPSLGTALALVIVAIAALAGRSDGVQRALAALPLVTAAELVRVALLGTPSSLEALVFAGLAVALAAVVALLGAPVSMFASLQAPAVPAVARSAGRRTATGTGTRTGMSTGMGSDVGSEVGLGQDDGVALGARRTPRPPTSRVRPPDPTRAGAPRVPRRPPDEL